jgi:hypothetical protein
MITEEKRKAILRELDRYNERAEEVYEEMVWELSQKLNLTMETVRMVLEGDLDR